jgi:mRNA interferase MazF
VIISGNVVNTLLNVVIACPLTTKIKAYKGNVVLEPNQVNGLSQKSEILILYSLCFKRKADQKN